MGVPLGLAALALGWHGLWAMTVPGPLDWDPAYYRDVAQHILAGEGAVSSAAWQAALTAGPLPVPADLHWMPLPSRVLLPGLALWPARGDQLVTALLAAAWAPLAWALARALGLRPAAAALAGLWAATGLGWVRFLSTPDVFALYGVIGAVGWLAVLRGATGWAAAAAVAAALSRGDGFVLGAALGLGLGGARGALVASAGLLAAGGWGAWAVASGGALALEIRAAALHAPDIGAFIEGVRAPRGIGPRLAALPAELGQLPATALVAGAGLLPLPALAGAALHRRRRAVGAALAFLVGAPLLGLLLAPAIAASGSPFRSGAALACLGAALGAAGIDALEHRLVARGWRRGVLFWGVAVGAIAAAGGIGLGNRAARPEAPVDCGPLEGIPVEAVVLTGRPLLVRARCGHSTVVLTRATPPAEVADRAARTGATYALLPEADVDRSVPLRADAARLLPGWTELRPGLFRAPLAD